MAKLWETSQTDSNKLVDEYTASEDAVLDNHLIEMDIMTNAAHVRMLRSCGYMNEAELKDVLIVLKELLAEYQQGKFFILPEDEDVHSRIENEVTKRKGAVGGKIHSGRSRNDQVLSDMRLYFRDKLIEISENSGKMVESLLVFGEKHKTIPMPGYTHMQRAMPSSVALWAGAFAEALLDDIQNLLNALNYNDMSPLGSGAGYGVKLGINREMTAELLGFSRVQVNPIYCQNSRGKVDGVVLGALSNVMLTLGKMASDLLLFTTAEFDFFKVPDSFTTGSSIMPQKKNLDIMELLRARVRTVAAYETQVKSISASIPSGYSRDLQETKGPIIESFKIVNQSLAITTALIDELQVNALKMDSCLTPDVYATDIVFAKVDAGSTFREAYRGVKENINNLEVQNHEIDISEKATLGTAENPGLKVVAKRLELVHNNVSSLKININDKKSSLLSL